MTHTSFETRLFLNNQFVPSSSPNPTTFTVIDPSNLKPIADVVEASKEDIDAAVENAKRAFPGWRDTSAKERANCLRRLGQLLRENDQKLIEMELTTGKPISMAKTLTGRAADNLDYYAGLAETIHGTTSLNTPDHLNMLIKQPYGVVAGILPFNVPMGMWCNKMAGAVAAGNTIILKSSEKAPLVPLFLSSLVPQAGFPPGVIQTVSGAANPGKLLAEHMEIRKISFTGSGPTGKKIMMASAGSNLKAVSLELGGKSPAIVFGDVDIANVIPLLGLSVSRNAGQVCMASTRIFVEESIAPQFTTSLTSYFASSQIGAVHDPSTSVGPVIDSIQASRIESFLDVGKTEGKMLTGGKVEGGEGLLFKPTIFTETEDGARINKEEIFGPVVVLHTFKTEDEAIRRANDTEFGLYASVFTKDIDRAIRVGKALEAGHVGINTTSPDTSVDVPFGGWKQSGIGREHGINALDIWLEEKALILKYKPTA